MFNGHAANATGYNTLMFVLKFLDHAWRLFATALSFAVFGVGGLIMGLLIFPLLFVFIRDRQRRRLVARKLIGGAFGGFWGMMRALRVLDCRIEGREHMNTHSNMLVIANHPTLIDVVILISLFPRANCVIKAAVTKNVFMRYVVRAADYISNNEPEALLESCVAYLESGGSLMLFPEGTRTSPGGNIEFKPGAAAVAARADVAILPVAIECRPLFLSKEQPWYFVPEQRPAFLIRIMPPLTVADLVPAGSNERQARHELNECLRNRIAGELRNMEFSEEAIYNA